MPRGRFVTDFTSNKKLLWLHRWDISARWRRKCFADLKIHELESAWVGSNWDFLKYLVLIVSSWSPPRNLPLRMVREHGERIPRRLLMNSARTVFWSDSPTKIFSILMWALKPLILDIPSCRSCWDWGRAEPSVLKILKFDRCRELTLQIYREKLHQSMCNAPR